jgi:hypothetical protein
VLINQYQPGEGIMHHTDGPLYHDCVVILSFGFPALMTFQPRLSSDEIGLLAAKPTSELPGAQPTKEEVSILLQPCSLLCFSKDAYSSYLHGIETWDQHGHHHTQEMVHSDCAPHSWHESAFSAYLTSKCNVIDKRYSDDDVKKGREGSGREQINAADGIRTSLTIRHMFH